MESSKLLKLLRSRRAEGLTAAPVSARLLQLSFLATLAIMLQLLVTLQSNYATERILKSGATVVLDPPDSPIRFLGFAVTLLFVAACLVTNRTLRRRELLLLISLGLSQLFCDRLEDFGFFFTWQFAALTLGILWHRVPFHPRLLSLTCWLFLLINLGATILRPSWAFFQMGYDEPTSTGFGRLAACTGHPNELGLYAGLLGLMVALNVRTRGWRVLWFGLMLLLILAQSKTSIVCYFIAFVCYRKQWRLPPWLAVLVPLLGIGNALLAASGVLTGSLSITGRSNLWAVLIEAVGRSPLIGFGMEGVKEATTDINVGFQAQNHAHNAGLQVLVQGGLIGLVCYCALMYFLAKTCNRSYLGSAVLLFMVIHTLTESSMPWIWAYLFVFPTAFTLSTMKSGLRATKDAVAKTFDFPAIQRVQT